MKNHKPPRWVKAVFTVHNGAEPQFSTIFSGRDRWAMECLMAAGAKVCAAIDNPGPRCADFVFNLRGAGLEINIITEPQEGDYPGQHDRYGLRSTATPIRLVVQEGAAA